MTDRDRSPDPRPRASTRAHLLDLLFFRILGLGMIYHEVAVTAAAEWPIILGAICMFFMPDWLRGTDSIPARVLIALAQRSAEKR